MKPSKPQKLLLLILFIAYMVGCTEQSHTAASSNTKASSESLWKNSTNKDEMTDEVKLVLLNDGDVIRDKSAPWVREEPSLGVMCTKNGLGVFIYSKDLIFNEESFSVSYRVDNRTAIANDQWNSYSKNYIFPPDIQSFINNISDGSNMVIEANGVPSNTNYYYKFNIHGFDTEYAQFSKRCNALQQ